MDDQLLASSHIRIYAISGNLHLLFETDQNPCMSITIPQFTVRLAKDAQDLRASQRLRYEVFVEELGGDGAKVDHEARLEQDEFDPVFDHLVLIDPKRNAADLDHVVGVYRLLPGDRMPEIGRFYSEDEYNLDAVKASGKRLLELGRSCVHPDYRGGTALYELWQGLAGYVIENKIDILFGVASFHGTDMAELEGPLANLHYNHMAPDDIRPVSRVFQPMDQIPPSAIDRLSAMRATPSLIKAYLRLGGAVGDGAYIDHAFNTVDVCLVMDVAKLSDKHRQIYTQGQGR